jgi:hypothetical protein
MDDDALAKMITNTKNTSLLSKTIPEGSLVDQVKGQFKGDNLKINARTAARGILSALGPIGKILAAGSESTIDTATQERLMTINDLREIILSICNYLFNTREIERNLNGKTVDILPRGISITKLANDIRQNNSGLTDPLLMDTLTFYGNNQGDESTWEAKLSRSAIAKYISTDWGKLLTNDEYIIPDGYPSDFHTKKNKKLKEGGKYLSSVDISPGDTVTILGKYLDTTDTEKKWWHINKSESNTAGTFVLNVKLESGMMGLLCDHNNSITDEEFESIPVLVLPEISMFHGIMTPESAVRASQGEGYRHLQKMVAEGEVERKAEEEKAAEEAAAAAEAAAAEAAEEEEKAAAAAAAAAAEEEKAAAAAVAAAEEEKAAAAVAAAEAERQEIMARRQEIMAQNKKATTTTSHRKGRQGRQSRGRKKKDEYLENENWGNFPRRTNRTDRRIKALKQEGKIGGSRYRRRGGNTQRRKTQNKKTQRRKIQRRKTQRKK